MQTVKNPSRKGTCRLIPVATVCIKLRHFEHSIEDNAGDMTKGRERRHGQVVRAARLWRRTSPYRVSLRLGFPMRQLENSLSVNPAVNGYLFRIREG